MYRVLKQNIYFVPGTETVLCFSPVRFYAALAPLVDRYLAGIAEVEDLGFMSCCKDKTVEGYSGLGRVDLGLT